MEKCQTCIELSEELYLVKITEIYVTPGGYYNYRKEIRYCPTCGKLIEYGKGRVMKNERSKKN